MVTGDLLRCLRFPDFAASPVSHMRRNLVPIVSLLSMMFVGGKLLLTPVKMQTCDFALFAEERGWPWVFAQSCSSKRCIDSVIDETNARIFSWSYFVADLVVLLASLAGAAVLFTWHWRRPARWYHSLCTLLLSVAVVALGMGWWSHETAQWKHEQQLIEHFATKGILVTELGYGGPEWLRRLWPVGPPIIFQRAKAISAALGVHQEEEMIELQAALEQMPHVRRLEVVNHSPLRLLNLAAFRRIEELYMSRGGVADDETVQAIATLPCLRRLDIGWMDQVSDHGLEFLLNCLTLEELDIAGCAGITDLGLRRLSELPKLRSLTIPGPPQISDETVRLLKRRIENVSTN